METQCYGMQMGGGRFRKEGDSHKLVKTAKMGRWEASMSRGWDGSSKG